MAWLAALSLGLAMTISGTPDQQSSDDRRMDWWREARFGMFIHWGLYAVPGGVWNGQNYPGASEWLMTTAKIKPVDYQPLLGKFNPVNFDARQWVRIAKDAGMKYIVITSKHHDGFALWHTKQNDWHIGNTPFKRDVLKELAQAAKEEGIRLCFYHSILDWTHPDYLPRREWDDRDTKQADFDRYVKFMKAQLAELLDGSYGDIGILWFDGEWEGTWTHERGKDLYAFVRAQQPNIIVNNRVDKGRAGMAGLTVGDFKGDYGTPEQEIPANGLPGVDWESCMTMNNSWGFHQNDHDWKSAKTLIQNLVDCASKGGNYLLNVGPNALGEIPQPSVERLNAMGDWLRQNGESIYGTVAGPFPKALPWGRVTQKPGKLYLHAFEPTQSLELPGLKADITRAYDLKTQRSLNIRHGERGPILDVALVPPDPMSASTVYVLEVKGGVEVVPQAIRADADGSLNLTAEDAEVSGHSARYEGGDKKAIGFWTDVKYTVRWPVEVPKSGSYEIWIEYACEAPSAGAAFDVSIGDRSVSGVVESTGSWSVFRDYRIGEAVLEAGRTTVAVVPRTKPGAGVMNLRSVRLKPKG